MDKLSYKELEEYHSKYTMSLRHRCWSGIECSNLEWCREHCHCKRGLDGEMAEMTSDREERIRKSLKSYHAAN